MGLFEGSGMRVWRVGEEEVERERSKSRRSCRDCKDLIFSPQKVVTLLSQCFILSKGLGIRK